LSVEAEKKPVPLSRAFGMIAHTELASTDLVATMNFLSRVFDWHFDRVQSELIPYETPGGTRGAVKKIDSAETPASMNYILVKDIEATRKEIVANGGEIVLPRVDIPKMGSFFWFKVPAGPVLACWADSHD
jgi:predicted enzyme related to lactoylglutathione lyase